MWSLCTQILRDPFITQKWNACVAFQSINIFCDVIYRNEADTDARRIPRWHNNNTPSIHVEVNKTTRHTKKIISNRELTSSLQKRTVSLGLWTKSRERKHLERGQTSEKQRKISFPSFRMFVCRSWTTEMRTVAAIIRAVHSGKAKTRMQMQYVVRNMQSQALIALIIPLRFQRFN